MRQGLLDRPFRGFGCGRLIGAALIGWSVFACRAVPVSASCNVIPAAAQSFRSTLGILDRPYARPGDWVTLSLDPVCHLASSGFAPLAADHVVTVVFTPPAGGPRNVVALATSCSGVDTSTCGARPDVDSARCVVVNQSFDPVSMELLDTRTLRFRFPDTDAFLSPANDGRPYAGPATIAVTRRGDPLPCELASNSCAQQGGVVACVDTLLEGNGSCDGTRHSTFPHFTALPHANSYQALCTQPVPPCTGLAAEIRAAVDTAGNALIPMDWRGVLVHRDTLPIARLLRSATDVEAFEGRGVPVRIPSLDSLSSFSIAGATLPPLFDPQRDPTQGGMMTLFGSADAPETVLRIARHRAPSQQCSGGDNDALPCLDGGDCPGGSCSTPSCVGGTNHGGICSVDTDCPEGECGPGLFDFSTRLYAASGPVVLRRGACVGGSNALATCTDNGDCPGGQCGSFSFVALDPVPLDGLTQSNAVNAFVLEEAADTPPVDLNGDGDTLDSVIKLGDRYTGANQPIGVNGSEGRAIVRIRQAPFSFPALAADGDVIAFLEPEFPQGNADNNGNGNVFDTILRVFRLDIGELTHPGLPIAADAAPVVGGKSLVASGGRIFFRSSEASTAQQITEMESRNSAGEPAQGGRENKASALSADSRHVVFHSSSPNLTPYPGPALPDYVFVRDRIAGTTTLISKRHNGLQTTGGSFWPTISANGRFVAFQSAACDLVPGDCIWPGHGETSGDINNAMDVFVHDRDLDGNGVFDEAGGVTTVLVSVASDGSQGNAHAGSSISLSTDGRFVAFNSPASNLVAGDTNDLCGTSGSDNCSDVFVHDRDLDEDGIFDEPGAIATVRVSVDSSGVQGNAASINARISGDGRFVAFESSATNLVSGDTNNADDIFLHDRDTDEDGIFDEPGAISTARVSVDSNGNEGNNWSREPHLAANGCCVAFSALANNLVAGDTNGFRDVFVHERSTGTTTLVTRTPQGGAGGSNSGAASISTDGRFVAFVSHAGNLGPTAGPHQSGYVHDRLTGQTVMHHRNSAGDIANDTLSSISVLSGDGRYVTFGSRATNLVADDNNNLDDIFLRGPDPNSGDLSGDGAPDDMILQVLDATGAAPAPVTSLCPTEAAAVHDGTVALLRPEWAGETPGLPLCPTAANVIDDKPDLNDDGDGTDAVVHLWTGSSVQNLARAATQVELSADWVAALVSEAAEGGTDFNADTDSKDSVVQVHSLSGGTWINVGQAADALAVANDTVAFLTPEAAQGSTDLNDDGDSQDRVLQVFDAGTARLTNVEQAAVDMVLGDSGLVAFRSREAAQGGQDLNDDGDVLDDVLQVYEPSSYTLIRSGMAVTPCRLEACDPRLPYRVLDDTVTYLTLESDQGVDLNDDGDLGDLVLQVLNVRQAIANGSLAGAVSSLAAVSAGLCTGTGEACASDEACGSGSCFVPPGGCLRNAGTACDPAANPGTVNNPCLSPHQFCQPILGAPNQGVCFNLEAACEGDADCSPGAYCNEGQAGFQRLMNPLAPQEGATAVFTGSGRCIEGSTRTCTLQSHCRTGEFCSRGTCRREHGVCAKDTNCPTGSVCEQGLLRSTAADRDGDEVPDAIDNCPGLPNILQEDGDGDGVGNACDTAECGNGIHEGGEACEDGNLIDGDGCDSNCTVSACGNGILTGSEQCDDGNGIAGDGCDPNCTPPACGNGYVSAGEECDDGNASDDDPCKVDCTYHRCGDGYLLSLLEECDDGNLVDGDGCESSCQVTVPRDVMVEPIAPVNVTMKKGHETTVHRFTVTARNAEPPNGPTGAFPVGLAASTDCPHLSLLGMDFDKRTGGSQETILLAPGAAAKATTEMTLYFSMSSLNRRSPFRCTITFTASSVPPYPDPMPSNDSVTVDVNVVDLNDPDQETSTESVLSSVKFLRIIVPRDATELSRIAGVSVVNADILPFKADPGHEISVSASDGTCPPGTVGEVDFDPTTSGIQGSATVKGGTSKRGKLSLTIDPAAFTSGNAKSPHRCVAILTASDAAPDVETTNDTTRLVIDVYDKNDF